MSYASYSDVVARAGRYGGMFDVPGKHPTEADIEGFLGDCAAIIDAALSGRGLNPATVPASVQAALLDLNAYGALARALPAAGVGSEAEDELAFAQQQWTEGLKQLADGSFPALAALANTGSAPTAGDFWADNPGYGRPEQMQGELCELAGTSLGPEFRRDTVL